MTKPSKKTLRDTLRGSVPDGKLAKAKIVLADVKQNEAPVGGFTEYDLKTNHVVKIGAPTSNDAWGITIRGHESAHATKHKPARKKPLTANAAIAGQIVDDVNIEKMPKLSATSNEKLRDQYKRAHLAVAMKDLRGIVNTAKAVKAGKVPDSIEYRNMSLTRSVRTLAMALEYGEKEYNGTGGVTIGNQRVLKTRNKSIRALKKAIGEKMVHAVHEVIKLARNSRTRNRAISLLTALMQTEEVDLPEVENEKPPDEGDLLAPVQSGDALDGHMKIVDLRPKTVFCSKEKSISSRYAPNGVIINPTRFVNAVVSGDANGLFARRVRQKAGGTVLIDASGSMGASKENLSQLCALVPSATVAYYSGTGCGKGTLVVYAFAGKRFAGEILHPSGGNAVDLPAIKWMMRLPKPWVLVSDLQFCGGVMGSEYLAQALVERHKERGDLTVYESLDAAFEAFGGKGLLKS